MSVARRVGAIGHAGGWGWLGECLDHVGAKNGAARGVLTLHALGEACRSGVPAIARAAGGVALHPVFAAPGQRQASERNKNKPPHFLAPMVAGALFSTFVARAHGQILPPYVGTTVTQTNGTITAGGTFQTALASNPSRKGCILVNTSGHTMDVYLGALADATAAKSLTVAAGNSFSCNYGPFVLTDNVNITTSTSTDTFIVVSW